MRWKQYYEHLISKLNIPIDMTKYKDGDDDLIISELDQIIESNKPIQTNENDNSISELEAKLLESSNQLLESLKINETQNLKLLELDTEIKGLKDSLADEIRISSSLKNELTQLNQLKIEYNNLKEDYNSISENYNVLSKNIIEKELNVSKSLNKINNLEGTIVELTSTINNQKLEISSLNNELIKLKNLVDQFETIKRNLTPHLENYKILQVEYGELKKSNEILVNKINTITNILGK
jgi:chromosome segregation ATPase